MNTITVALFPIPNAVNFPGVPCPLHVFEPRYRKMVKHCLDNDMLMGVCHTEKILHSNKKQQTLEDTLNSNQSTYKPCTVFSAGKVEILEELEDGRMAIMVDMAQRLELQQEVQTLPFGIWQCTPVQDSPVEDHASLEQLKKDLLAQLLVVTQESPDAQDILNGEYWNTISATEFSFAINGLLGMDASLKQHLLEMTVAEDRLNYLLALINNSE
ncbi:LON peptidase substrate-binding domain-containing protein [Oceanicoccus sagamiensis]|uniref:Lon N-terminal domain-containing protein n=1 Tax=Oceanicoccus sagamiensis TaxID=716816 RepID=A0A1X9NAV0_9GAMM|nr:LON peptidase substrate-binding domain-containing protein [Oceanicoccus sagamiensis]ARN75168.1 hypothetical protein BST96_14215 [Oceanicoccus sagamiensis]